MLLRPRQVSFVERCRVALDARGNTLGVAPTGSGKTVMISALVGHYIDKGVDSALILQFDAGLIPSLACIQDADVNEDGFINAIDAALLIQFRAFPIESLPPGEPTPAGLSGDVDCDDTVDSIDATLILQFDARLITRLRCQENADVNGDGTTDSIDAALISQIIIDPLLNLPPHSPDQRPLAAFVTRHLQVPA